jgi:hypothetical protein
VPLQPPGATVVVMGNDDTSAEPGFFERMGDVIKDIFDGDADAPGPATGGIGNTIGGLVGDVLDDVFTGKPAPKTPPSEITHVRSDAKINDFLRHALDQVGDRHQKGAEASLSDADPDAWDSSELVEWSANVSGVMVNDGSWLQYRQLNRQGGDIGVDDALRTPGALVFTFSSDPLASRDRPSSAGVAISLGNGQVITVTPGGKVEVVDASTREFSHAAVMPGFQDARQMSPDDRDALQDLMKEHGLPLPKPDLFDPDNDGVPMSPDEATERIADLNKEAQRLRDQAEHAEDYHDRRDADLEVARALLKERESDFERQNDAVARAARAEAEAESDLYRSSPELRAAAAEVIEIQHKLGIPVPSERDLLTPDGDPHPAPPPPETDPVKVEQLRGELVFAQAHVDQLIEDQQPLATILDQRVAERTAAEQLLKAAEAAVNEQKSDIAEIDGDREYDTPEAFLKIAREKEAEAELLTDRADEVKQRWEDYQKAHPDTPPTDLGEIEVRTSGAEAYAEGRRERAAELEDEAADLEVQSIRDERAAIERSELSDLRDERAEDLLRRADEAAARAVEAQRLSAEATEQANEWAATADRRLADAARLRAAGRTDDADVMKSRAERANEAGIEQSIRSSELNRDVEAFTAQAAAWKTEATDLARQADLLDEEAAELSASAKAADDDADDLQERAKSQDRHADLIDARLESGVGGEVHIKDDIEGIDVVIKIPGRPPTEADLPATGKPGDGNDPLPAPAQPPGPSTPSSQVAPPADDVDVSEQPVAIAESPTFEAAPEPAQDFAAAPPEPDMTDQLFDGLGGPDDNSFNS